MTSGQNVTGQNDTGQNVTRTKYHPDKISHGQNVIRTKLYVLKGEEFLTSNYAVNYHCKKH